MGSKTEAVTNTAGSGFQDVEDTNSIDVSGVNVHKSTGTSFQFTQTDHGAVEKSFELVENEAEANRVLIGDVGAGLLAESEANRVLIGNVGAALVNESAANRALIADAGNALLAESEANRVLLGDIGAGILEESENNRIFSAGVVESVLEDAENNRVFVAGVTNEAFELTERELENNRIFSAGVIDQAYTDSENNRIFAADLVNESFELTQNELENNRRFSAGVITKLDDAYRSNADANLKFAAEQSAQAQATASAALASNERIVDDTFTFVAGGVKATLDTANQAISGIRTLAGETLNDYSDSFEDVLFNQAEANNDAIQLIGEAARSDAANSLDQVVKFATYAFMGLAVATVASRYFAR